MVILSLLKFQIIKKERKKGKYKHSKAFLLNKSLKNCISSLEDVIKHRLYQSLVQFCNTYRLLHTNIFSFKEAAEEIKTFLSSFVTAARSLVFCPSCFSLSASMMFEIMLLKITDSNAGCQYNRLFTAEDDIRHTHTT